MNTDRLIERIGDARFVLLGEASHGTQEFYAARAEITQRLVAEKGFDAVAVEADWPDAYRVNRYVRGESDDADAEAALGGFQRFPTWMWRNTVVRDFVEWLRRRNAAVRDDRKAGFYGLDLYSLFHSVAEVLAYLDKVDPPAARAARERYACLDHMRAGPHADGKSCEDEVVRQLVELRRHAADYARRDGRVAPDEHFYAEQNARLIADAEEYYRAMYRGRASSWNLRDRHMAETLQALRAHLDRPPRPAKIAVWAHNSHLGDARATEMSARGEWSVGQLARERYGTDTFLVGFTTYRGTVTAAPDWDAPAQCMRVLPGLPQSVEAQLHEAGAQERLLLHRDFPRALAFSRLERFIGVVYRPQTERFSHYMQANVSEQFDALLHFDETRALQPLERSARWHAPEPAETYPSGL